ncbi:MAG: hypothetical protein J6K92_12455 [Oscillospiraceae bacterium]|nr:hypothetical protein [Oscillospiraceae bacterium]
MIDKEKCECMLICDKALRAAVSGSDEDFKNILSEIILRIEDEDRDLFSSPFSTNINFYYSIILRLLQLILTEKNDIRKFDILFDSIEDIPLTDKSCILKAELLTISCIRSNDEMTKRLLDKKILNKLLNCSVIFENPFYILFLFGKKDIAGRLVNMLLDDYKTPIHTFGADSYMILFNIIGFAKYIYSDEFAEFLFGQATKIPIELIPNIASCPEMLEYIIKNKYKCFGFEDREEPPRFDEFLRSKNSVYDEELIIKVLYEIYCSSDEKTFRRYFDECSPITTIRLSNLYTMNIDEIKNYLTENVINKIIAPNVTVRIFSSSDLNALYQAENFLSGSSISYDLSEMSFEDEPESDSEYVSFYPYSLPNIVIDLSDSKKFLKKVINVPHITSLCEMIRHFLNFDSKPLTKLMISKGLINSDNLSEAVCYASDKKLYRSLCELSHMCSMDGNVKKA